MDAVPVILATVNVAVDGLNEIPAFANTVSVADVVELFINVR